MQNANMVSFLTIFVSRNLAFPLLGMKLLLDRFL